MNIGLAVFALLTVNLVVLAALVVLVVADHGDRRMRRSTLEHQGEVVLREVRAIRRAVGEPPVYDVPSEVVADLPTQAEVVMVGSHTFAGADHHGPCAHKLTPTHQCGKPWELHLLRPPR